MRFWPRNNENVLIVGRVLADIRDLLVYVTFNATAQRRIKLRQIADFQARQSRDTGITQAIPNRSSNVPLPSQPHSPIPPPLPLVCKRDLRHRRL